MKDTSAAISDLKSKWQTLHALDRARDIEKIHKAGTSLRSLARELECGESGFRHLLEARHAPLEDQILARKNEISTNELVLRAKAAGTRREEKQAEDLKRKRTRDSIAGCKRICDWIRSEKVAGPCGVNVVSEARDWLDRAERNKQLPRGSAPAGTTVAEIIQRCRPPEMTTDGYSYVAWYQLWMIRWAYFSMPDHWVRYKAIELALEKQHRR